MVTLIHGEDTAASRNYYQSIKAQIKDSVTFDGAQVTLTDLVQVIDGGGLFSEGKHIFLEDFFTKKKSEKSIADILIFLDKSTDSSVYFWEGKEIGKKQYAASKKMESKVFKFPQTLFAFLDSIGQSPKSTIQKFHDALQYTPAELIFFMMVRQFRLLLAIETTSDKAIDEAKRLAPWQIAKLKKQYAFFPIHHLQTAYQNLFAIDYALKTGQSSVNHIQAIDFFLAEI